jgi:hypothetical protein
MESILSLLKPYIEALLGQYGPALQAAAAVVAIMGIARAIFKPLFTFLHAVADATPTQKDNAILSELEASPVYKGVSFALDYIASIKLPPKK